MLRQWNEANDLHGCWTTVRFAISKTQPGAVSGEFTLRRGERTARVRLRASVLPADMFRHRILVLDSPFSGQSTTDGSHHDGWRRVVAQGQLAVEYLSGTELDVAELARADAVLVAEDALRTLRDRDIARLHGFICGGGRVVVSANRFFVGTVDQANKIIEPFGLRMDDAEPSSDSARRELDDWFIIPSEFTANIDTVSISRPSPTHLTNPTTAIPLVRLNEEDLFAAIARTPNGGGVATLGTSLWWAWVGENTGNEKLLLRVLTHDLKTRGER